ncbi:MAG: protein NrnU [Betaproteobacteria bacterium]|jgi:uncharacterized membrane protein|nr:protein NrnU [Betaproteobacteria bacterium]NBT11001.1 protein NrnU [Betaproteobacteria bacterium]NBU50372.1 protein NrnU [Betaproteobacteria bacterium]
MNLLILGLIVFLGIHSARVFGEGPRQAVIDRFGPMAWKGVYSVLSVVGFVLLIQGYAAARLDPIVLWVPPVGMRHAASVLTLLAFILLAAAYVPGNPIKARLRHPMTLAVKTWALAHLLSNGNGADVLLFGGFLVWAVLVFRAARARDRIHPPAPVAVRPMALLWCVVVGSVAWAAFAFWAHAALIGVRPFGGA